MKKNKLKIIALALFVGLAATFFLSADSENKNPEEPIINEREAPGAELSQPIVNRLEGVSLPDIEAEAAYSVYLKDGQEQILFSRDRNEPLPIASITKLMTALIVYENYDLSEPIGVPESEYFTDSHLRDLRVFADTTFEELLHPLLLESNNSGAYAAATAPDDIEFDDFIKMMNQRADELKMKRTIYHNPSGLDTVRGVNLSSARDTAKLIEKLLEYDLLWEIMQKRSYEVHSHRSSVYYLIETTNKFLDGSYFTNRPDWHQNIIGGKTGFTYRAMGCLVMVLEVDDGYIINVILGADGREERFEEMENLIDWIYRAYEI